MNIYHHGKKIVLLFAAFSACTVPALAQCELPSMPAPLRIEVGLPGQPPEIQNIEKYESEKSRIEIWKISANGSSSSLFARVWWPDGFVQHRTKYYNFTLEYLKGSGPSGFRLFPAGTYMVRQQGWNRCGFGTWSAHTEFYIAPVNVLAPDIVGFPTEVGLGDDLSFSWTNNFAASSYKFEIRRNGKVVRKGTEPGWYYFAGVTLVELISSGLYGASYRDRPAKPEQELPDATGYVFRVSAYSPNVKKWSPWAEVPFRIERGTPVSPTLRISQQDFEGFFDKSPRPFFIADYGDGPPPLWSRFDIRRKEGDKLKPVRTEWLRRYDGYENVQSFGGSDPWRSPNWSKDIPHGEYVWSVQPWNSPAPGESVVLSTNSIISPAVPLDKPSPPIAFEQYSDSMYLRWRAIPNAYTYQVEIYKKGALFKKSPLLDVISGKVSDRFQISFDGTWAEWYSRTAVQNRLSAGIRTVHSLGN